MQGKKVLIIDDDPEIRRIAQRVFARAGAHTFCASDGAEGLRLYQAYLPDLVILDIMMPGQDGFEVCRELHRLSEVPVIMLTALHQEQEIVHGLEVGADDFVTKPFSQSVLLARARAILRRANILRMPEKPAQFHDEYLEIDLEQHRLQVNGKLVKLTPTEYRLLAYLVQNAGRMLSFAQILEHVWGWEYQDSPDYVHVYISHLRQKIEPDPKHPRYILTEHGLGYRFEKP